MPLKNKKKKAIDKAAEELAQIFCMQIETKRRKKQEKIHDKEKV